MKMGVAGAVYANVATNAVQALAMSGYTLSRVGLRFRWERARTVVGFSFPMVLASLGSYYIGFADRYFLKIFGDLETVGLYTMAARFGLVFFAFGFTPFGMAWDAERYQIARQPDAIPRMQQIFRILSAYLIVLGFAISLFAEEVLRLLSAEPFWAAAPLIPIFIANSLTMAWGAYARFGLLLKRNTREIARVNWLAVPVTTLAFVLLIPPLGAVGAALAVAAGNVFRLAYVEYRASRLYDMRLQWRRVLLVTLAFAAAVSGAQALDLRGALQWTVDCTLLFAGFALAWFGPVLDPQDRHLVLEKVRSVATFVRVRR
jgi:O-antigen/teichoic acid export membrane protein